MFRRPLFKYPEDNEAWRGLYPTGPGGAAGSPADQWLGEVLVEFWQFSDKYFGYFEGPKGIIAQSLFDATQTTAARLQQRVLQAIDEYFTTIGRVAEQRQVKHYRTVLDDGTSRAKAFLQPLGLDLPVLIYFDKAAGVRHYPFTDAVFVGTPYQLAFEGDWMSIPHEIGHYLYWNLGQDESGSLTLGNLADSRRWQEELKAGVDQAVASANSDERGTLQRMLLSWLEEIFADVLGTRIGGPPFADSLRKQIARMAGGKDDLKEDDGEHPPLCVRPSVRTHTLQLHGETPTTDFDDFFAQAFKVKDVSRLELRALLDTPEERLEKMKKTDLVAAIREPPSISLKAGRVKSALERLVGHLKLQIDRALSMGLPQPAVDPVLAFDRLVDLAKEQAKLNGKRPYENLLQPIILEGGEYHSGHDVSVHGKPHRVGGHPH